MKYCSLHAKLNISYFAALRQSLYSLQPLGAPTDQTSMKSILHPLDDARFTIPSKRLWETYRFRTSRTFSQRRRASAHACQPHPIVPSESPSEVIRTVVSPGSGMGSQWSLSWLFANSSSL